MQAKLITTPYAENSPKKWDYMTHSSARICGTDCTLWRS